jgi:hypothetical protein
MISGSEVTCNRYTRLEQLAFIHLVFERNARGDWLDALEPGGRLEIGTLLAAVQSRATLGALTLPVNVP